MALFTIADPHLSLGSDKPMDIFRGWTNYTDKLREQWEATVCPGDTVVLPGDISWAMSLPEAKNDLAFLDALPGTKIIGKGNHDFWWATMRKMEQFVSENGFESVKFLFNNAFLIDGISVCGSRGWFFDAEQDADTEKIIRREAGRLRMSLEQGVRLGGELAVFMHYPVAADGKVCAPILDVLKEFGVTRCFFGHLHGNLSAAYADYTVSGIRFSLISADFLGFCPKKADI